MLLALAKRLVQGTLLAYVTLVAGLYAGQRHLLYPRPEPKPIPAEGRTLTVTYDGGTVPVWIVGDAARTVVWFHGNAQQVGTSARTAHAFTARGFRFVAPEYAGYGEATGAAPDEAHILAAASRAMDALAAEGIGPVDCVGYSLGTGVASAMAADGRCERLALVAAFTSLPDAAQADYPFVPARWLVRDQLATLARAPRVAVPTLLVHGTHDPIVPLAQGRTLAAAFPDARLVVRERKGHLDVLDDATYDAVAAFLTEAAPEAGARSP